MKLKVKGILRTPIPLPTVHINTSTTFTLNVCVCLELIENPFSLILKILIRGDGVLLVG